MNARQQRQIKLAVANALKDYPERYDAHHDGLAHPEEHKDSVNQLLKALREIDAVLKAAS